MSQKRIQITSNLQADTARFYERVLDKDTGEIKVVDKQKPSTSSSSTTITTNPYAVETDGTNKTKDKVGSVSKTILNDSSLDASQL